MLLTALVVDDVRLSLAVAENVLQLMREKWAEGVRIRTVVRASVHSVTRCRCMSPILPGRKKGKSVRSYPSHCTVSGSLGSDLLERKPLVLQEGQKAFLVHRPKRTRRKLDANKTAKFRYVYPLVLQVRILNPLNFPHRVGNVVADERRRSRKTATPGHPVPLGDKFRVRLRVKEFRQKRSTIYVFIPIVARILMRSRTNTSISNCKICKYQ